MKETLIKLRYYTGAMFSVLLGAVVLLYPVLLNHYPLVYSDTGTYITSGFLNTVPNDRPILYGLLIRHLSLGYSLFVFIMAQSILVSLSIYTATKRLLTDRTKTRFAYWICIGFLVCLTGLPWFTSWMMPDVYTGVSALLLIVILFSPGSLKQNGWLILLYYALTLTHLSNILTHVLFTATMVLMLSLHYLITHKVLLPARRMILVTIMVLSNYLLITGINYGFERQWFLSKGNDIFITAKLCDYGLLNEYLDSHCATEPLRICQWKDDIKPDLSYFLWSPESALYKMGGWTEPDEEFAVLNGRILSDPRMLEVFVSRGLAGSADQLLSVNVGQDFLNYGDSNSAPFVAVNWFLKKDVASLVKSRQNTATLDFPFYMLNNIEYYLQLIVFVLIIILLFQRIRVTSKMVLVAAILLLIYNAGVCAFLTSVGGRYQGRIVWILFIVFIIETINNQSHLKQLFGYRPAKR